MQEVRSNGRFQVAWCVSPWYHADPRGISNQRGIYIGLLDPWTPNKPESYFNTDCARCANTSKGVHKVPYVRIIPSHIVECFYRWIGSLLTEKKRNNGCMQRACMQCKGIMCDCCLLFKNSSELYKLWIPINSIVYLSSDTHFPFYSQ